MISIGINLKYSVHFWETLDFCWRGWKICGENLLLNNHNDSNFYSQFTMRTWIFFILLKKYTLGIQYFTKTSFLDRFFEMKRKREWEKIMSNHTCHYSAWQVFHFECDYRFRVWFMFISRMKGWKLYSSNLLCLTPELRNSLSPSGLTHEIKEQCFSSLQKSSDWGFFYSFIHLNAKKKSIINR